MKFPVTRIKDLVSDLENESVFAVDHNDVFYPLRNISDSPEKRFKVSRREIDSIKNIKYLFHTHVSDDQPGELTFDDIKGSKDSKIPFLMWHTKFDEWDYYDPADINPYPLKKIPYAVTSPEYYTSWRFQWWRCDCYTIVRSYYKGILGISLKDFERDETEDPVLPTWNRFQENFSNQGFKKVREPQKHDVLLFNTYGNANGHHLGIYLGDEEFLHLLKPGSLSKIETFHDFYKQSLVGVWRRC